MDSEPNIEAEPDHASLPPEWLAALKAFPSEHATPSPETDAIIIAEAHAALAATSRHKMFPRMLWPALAAAACVAFGLLFLSQDNGDPSPQQAEASPDEKYNVILREVSAVFPHQVKAIMTDGGELQIALSEEPVPDGAQAVVIEACGNGGCTVVITYVGQTVEIHRQHVTVRAGEHGAIIIKGRQEPASDLQIKYRSI